MKKKILFFVMAVMATTFFVPNVYAGTSVAKIGSAEYSTLQEAINAATAGETVTLVADTEEDITIAADKDIILDTGTFTLTNHAGHTITNYGKLTIKGNGTIDNVTHGKGALVNKGTTTVLSSTFTRSEEAGTRTGNGGNSWYVIDNNGTEDGTNAVLTFKGGKVVNTSGHSSLIKNEKATLIVEDGTFENDFIVLKNDEYGVMKVSGGKISTKAAGGSAVQNWSELTMTGGELNAVGGAVAISTYSWTDNYPTTNTIMDGTINGNIKIQKYENYNCEAPVVKIEGGDITGNIVATNYGKLEVVKGNIDGTITSDDTATVTTAGGTYSDEPSAETIPEGYKVFDNEDGTYTVAIPVRLTLKSAEGEETGEIPKGTVFTAEEYQAMVDAINAALEADGLKLKGFYLDEDLADEFDFSTPINEDLELYMEFEEITPEKKEVNPETSDVNLFLILSLATLGTLGTALVLKNRLS